VIASNRYLPRKFKAVVAIPPYNDVDVFAHDLGYIAIVENDIIVGYVALNLNEVIYTNFMISYNVTVGGGMGMTHGNKKTFPRVADVLGFIEKHQAIDVGEKVCKRNVTVCGSNFLCFLIRWYWCNGTMETAQIANTQD
jgi:sulfite reductase (NADPH) hemoprotein beta-component